MDSTTHTTTTVEFVDWRAKAKEKLEAEDKLFKGGRAAASVQSYVLRALLNFADQEPRFAEVVCNTERTFSECCAAARTMRERFCLTLKRIARPCSSTSPMLKSRFR